MKPTENIIQQNAHALPADELDMPPNYPDKNSRIAELAYFKAEQRGFEPGHEIEDWLEAERELASAENQSAITLTSART